MFRNLLLKAAARAKADGAADTLMRYNPLLRGRVRKAINAADMAALEARMLRAAKKTRYGAGRSNALVDWPLLGKDQIRAAPQDFISAGSLIRIPAATGGTTGIPLKLWRSLESIVAEQVFIDGLLAPHGFSMRSKMAVLRADSIKAMPDTAPPYGRISHSGNRLTLSSPHLNPQTLSWFHDALLRFAPDILWVYPSAALNLLTLCERANLKLDIPLILASSEELPPAVHTALEQYFHSRVINYYGQAERVCFAYSTKPGEFYFNPAYGKVELIAAEDGAAKIIGSNYWNLAMPLPRYDTGDLLFAPEGEWPDIAAGKRPFTGMAGRDGEYLVTSDGMRIIGMNQIPREIKNIFQLQLVQTDPATLRIDVIAMPGFSASDGKDIEARARAKVPPSIAISVQAVERLRLTPRGKAPLVVRLF